MHRFNVEAGRDRGLVFVLVLPCSDLLDEAGCMDQPKDIVNRFIQSTKVTFTSSDSPPMYSSWWLHAGACAYMRTNVIRGRQAGNIERNGTLRKSFKVPPNSNIVQDEIGIVGHFEGPWVWGLVSVVIYQATCKTFSDLQLAACETACKPHLFLGPSASSL